jgi:PAS domain S-box-containing protein
MRTTPHASLAVAVAAIRELIEQTRASRRLDGETAQALDFALNGLGLLWGALEGEQESHGQYERDCIDFFEFAPQPCVLTDLNGRVRCANGAAAKLLGVSVAELQRKLLASFFPPEHDVLTADCLLELTTHSPPRAIHWRTTVQRKAGSTDVEANVSEIGRRRGSANGLCWLLLPLARVLDAEIAVPQRAIGVELR